MKIIQRAEAVSEGLSKYFTGKPCKRGHVSERLVSCKVCIACQKIASLDYRARNRAGIAKQAREKRAENPEAYKAYVQRYRGSNKEKVRDQQSAYKKKNRWRINMLTSRYRVAKIQAKPSWYGEFDDFVIAEAHDLAVLRQRIFGFQWHVDHQIPLRGKLACGLHWHQNVQVIPQSLNNKKSNRLFLTNHLEWVALI
jgi:hypothetical protein